LCNSANGDIASCNKNNSEWGFCVFFKQNLVSFQKPKKHIKKTVGLFLSKKRVFLSPDYLSILFRDFLLIARSGTSHVTISLIGCAPHT